ncbi:glutathione S-transferase-like [Rhodnius prolixus]|uniref:glutathione transferase n=2 Tax=Rhodnius TaxID=13248 RepID=R4G3S8_RHOPR
MSKYRLTYFNVKGLGEPIRILLSYMDKEFEDFRLEKEDWPPRKKQTLFGKLPTLEIDGKVICESSAICRYLAVEAGLSGKNDWENLQIDMIVGTVMDIHFDIVTFVRENDPKKKEELRMKLLKETIPFYFEKYEERVKNNNYIANNSLSWADIFFIAYSECIDGLVETKSLDKYRHLNALKEKLYSIPNIKNWIQKRPDTR